MREWRTSKGKPSPCSLFARKFNKPVALRLLNMGSLTHTENPNPKFEAIFDNQLRSTIIFLCIIRKWDLRMAMDMSGSSIGLVYFGSIALFNYNHYMIVYGCKVGELYATENPGALSDPKTQRIVMHEVLQSVCMLTQDQYGNYVVQVMMKDQFANYVIHKLLESFDDHKLELILNRIKVHLNALKKYTYEKHIVSHVDKLAPAGGTYSLPFPL
ncbi:hypothetical protein RHMOL_Rhmol07G0163500 [Rhododendron molle]|uniref:Uncharacterized protein n=3 Tax=Rhododendron molle TaxID=49168 RepID=A0ACC0N2F4_RHOML|nr:hypothetical protein RHMOL_Rhmol07G0163500 [Rhododendron molle]KAI8547014.1 hypothetical protein RHMOL_Rhmol07G0163500 [Rhododendron molle]KAI8547017.1 hypothetical protein RHMOL_Rhmol07G0163500 [Rhododendron molle]